MIPVANLLQVIILIVHGHSLGHIPQQCQPKGAESEAELRRTCAFLATGNHYRLLLQKSPLRVPELYLETGKRESLGSWRTPHKETQRAKGACLQKVPPLWASFAKVARSAAGRRAAEGGGRTGMHVIVGLTSQTDGQALRSAGVWQVGSPARLTCCFSSPAFLFFGVFLLLLLLSSKNRVTKQFQLNPLTVSFVFPHAADPREHLFKEK